jgi:diguanylate cyclase (GGDEF)-like protein/PAS domain S-box-containing protein
VSTEPTELHALLQRQLRRLKLQAADAPAAWGKLLEHVSRAYTNADQERYLLERSQEVSSAEMGKLYEQQRAERDLLDVRVRERTEALRLSEARLASLVSLSADWIWEQDPEGCIVYISESVYTVLGIEPRELIGKSRLQFEHFNTVASELEAYEKALKERRPFRNFRYSMLRRDGSPCHLNISGEPVFSLDGQFEGYRGVGADITLATEAALQVERLARFDSLTGLPNRARFMEEIERAIARARRAEGCFALAFIDLDRFKNVNDSLGHAAGDELLRSMGKRLSSMVRESDMVARLGGDEFVVLLDNLHDTGSLDMLAKRLLLALQEPLVLLGQSVHCSGSIGFAVFPGDGSDAASLIKHADVAMYQAKQAGKNRACFYTGELAHQVSRQFQLEAELRQALERDELVLHFQPKFSLPGRELVGMEALVRWQHPQRGLVGPGEFIGLAEERGLIVPLGRWVMNSACQQMRQWLDAGLDVPPCSVNVSAVQLASEGLLDDIAAVLARHRLPQGMLEVELTESSLMHDPNKASEVLRAIDAMGVRLSIDDFGTGYSSLSYLKRFAADCLKIDRSFVNGLPGDQEDRSITEAVIALAHSLKLSVVAEGVETEAQLQLLSELGCDMVQGYLTGRPVSAQQFQERLESGVCVVLAKAA